MELREAAGRQPHGPEGGDPRGRIYISAYRARSGRPQCWRKAREKPRRPWNEACSGEAVDGCAYTPRTGEGPG
jgi:hypothetical protein